MTRSLTPLDVETMVRRALHAFDAEGRDLDGAYKHLYKAMDHLYDARDGKVEFDEDIFGEHVKNATDCLKAGAKDESSEAERDRKAEEARDSAIALDSLFQRDPDRARGEAFAARFNQRRSRATKPRKATPQHAQDRSLADCDIDELFQINR